MTENAATQEPLDELIPAPACEPELPVEPSIIYACSGSSDAGELADRIARMLAHLHLGEMSCLAGVAGHVHTLMNKAKRAESILVIDGCPLNCASKTLKLAGLTNFKHLELQRIGLRKGFCPVTPARLELGVQAAAAMLAVG